MVSKQNIQKTFSFNIFPIYHRSGVADTGGPLTPPPFREFAKKS